MSGGDTDIPEEAEKKQKRQSEEQADGQIVRTTDRYGARWLS